jgi:hypothetical protein
MEEIINRIWVGSDKDHQTALSRGWTILVTAKNGSEGSHRSLLQYQGRSAPAGKNYYFVDTGKVAAENLIDVDDPRLIAAEAVNDGLEFLKKHYEKDENILIHCNHGVSRGPTTALMFLRTLGEFPGNFHKSCEKLKTLYPQFDPAQGIKTFAQANWRNLLWRGKTENVHNRYTKEEAQYEFPAKMEHYCKDCIHFQSPSSCSIVVGLIEPKAWCRFWEKKKEE